MMVHHGRVFNHTRSLLISLFHHSSSMPNHGINGVLDFLAHAGITGLSHHSCMARYTVFLGPLTLVDHVAAWFLNKTVSYPLNYP